MAYKNANHKNVYAVSINADGGLNYSVSPRYIADNELQFARNIIYDSQTGKPMTRPGTVCVTLAAAKFASPILRLHYYEKDASNKWLVCASGGKLYHLSADETGKITTEDDITLITETESSITTEQTSPGYTWTEIGALTDSTTVPSFLTFNSTLLIADGGQHIRTWDGTTYTTLSDGLYATALSTIKGRVVANSSDMDLVTLSKAEDQTVWATESGAVALRAGFGDELSVNGFAVFGDDLIISKKGVARKMLYRLNIADATPANWYVQALTENNCAQNHQSIVSAFNNVYFIDTNGFKSLRGITEYGDLQVDMLGSKINKVFSGSPTSDDMAYIPAYTAMWFCMSDRVFAFHRITDTDGNVKFAYTDMVFQQGRIRCAVQTGTTIYLGGNNGYLYSTSDTYGTDQVSPTSTLNYTSKMTTKSFSVMGDLIVRRVKVGFSPKVAGNGNISANDTILKEFESPAAGDYLHDATGYLADATAYLYAGVAQPWKEDVRNRYRSDEIAFSINSVSGRVVIEAIDVEMAMVEGQ